MSLGCQKKGLISGQNVAKANNVDDGFTQCYDLYLKRSLQCCVIMSGA